MFQAPPFDITPEILNFVGAIDEFKGAWRASRPLSADRLAALEQAATGAGAAASLRIEGIEHPDDREIAAYADVLGRIFRDHADMALTETLIDRLHRDLLPKSPHDSPHNEGLGYKSQSNDLPSLDETGQPSGIGFTTATPLDTPRRMRDLVTWAHTELATRAQHPLLTIALFAIGFLEIMPYQAGNGRLSRVLVNLLLLRAGYAYVPYSALDVVLENDKEAYFQSILATQADLPDGQPWLMVFFEALHMQTLDLAFIIAQDRSLTQALPELSLQIMAQVATHGRVTVAEMAALTRTNRNTLKEHFRQLVETRHLTLHGAGRGAWYGPA